LEDKLLEKEDSKMTIKELQDETIKLRERIKELQLIKKLEGNPKQQLQIEPELPSNIQSENLKES